MLCKATFTMETSSKTTTHPRQVMKAVRFGRLAPRPLTSTAFLKRSDIANACHLASSAIFLQKRIPIPSVKLFQLQSPGQANGSTNAGQEGPEVDDDQEEEENSRGQSCPFFEKGENAGQREQKHALGFRLRPAKILHLVM